MQPLPLRADDHEKTYTSGAKPHKKDFLKYIKSLYTSGMLCCSAKWADCRKITDSREEANEGLDVEQLLRRMNHHEDCISLQGEGSLHEETQYRPAAPQAAEVPADYDHGEG